MTLRVQGPLRACIRVAQALGCCRRLCRRECRGPCGRASESHRPWVVAEGCGAANAEAPVGVHPRRAGLGLLQGLGAGPEPDVLQARLDWPVVSTPVSVAVPTSNALCLFLKVISAGPVAYTPVSVAGPAGELRVQVLPRLVSDLCRAGCLHRCGCRWAGLWVASSSLEDCHGALNSAAVVCVGNCCRVLLIQHAKSSLPTAINSGRCITSKALAWLAHINSE